MIKQEPKGKLPRLTGKNYQFSVLRSCLQILTGGGGLRPGYVDPGPRRGLIWYLVYDLDLDNDK